MASVQMGVLAAALLGGLPAVLRAGVLLQVPAVLLLREVRRALAGEVPAKAGAGR